MRPADVQVLAFSGHGNTSASAASDQEELKRKASELIRDREERDGNALRAEHLNGNGWNDENGAEERTKSRSSLVSKGQMITGCVPCLIVGIPCNLKNPRCRLAMSTEWSANEGDGNSTSESTDHGLSPNAVGLNTLRLDTKWRRNWRERHSLNFFVTFVSVKNGSQHISKTLLTFMLLLCTECSSDGWLL